MAGTAGTAAHSLTAESRVHRPESNATAADARPWDANHPLARLATRRSRDFDFFQLLHLLERVVAGATPLGETGSPRGEVVRLRPSLSLGFPPGDVADAEWRDDPNGSGRLLVTATFLGLYGSDSPLPTHFTESLLPEQDEDIRVRDFLDTIHHRIYGLLYRVWKKYRYYVQFRSEGDDAISVVVRGLLGLGTRDVDRGLRVHPVRLFRYAGLLSQRPRSASGLVGQLSDYFNDLPVDVEACVGRWLRIQPGDLNVLGQAKCSLGQDFLLGERLFDCSGKFRVKVGPVHFDEYTNFLPNSPGAADLAELVHFYCDDPFEFDVKVTLRGEEVPDLPLGEHGMLGRLSWTSWLKSQPTTDKSVVLPARKTAPQ